MRSTPTPPPGAYPPPADGSRADQQSDILQNPLPEPADWFERHPIIYAVCLLLMAALIMIAGLIGANGGSDMSQNDGLSASTKRRIEAATREELRRQEEAGLESFAERGLDSPWLNRPAQVKLYVDRWDSQWIDRFCTAYSRIDRRHPDLAAVNHDAALAAFKDWYAYKQPSAELVFEEILSRC